MYYEKKILITNNARKPVYLDCEKNTRTGSPERCKDV